MNSAVQRCLGAAAVLGVLLVVALVIDVVLEQTRPGVFAAAADAFASPSARDGPEKETSALGEGTALRGESWGLEGLAVSGGSDGEAGMLPEGFVSEVLAVDQLADLRVGANGSVVGFSLLAEPARVFAVLEQRLAERGWRVVPAGSGFSGTFVKKEGRFNWLYVACVQVGDTTSVVVQCVATQRKD